MDAQKISKCPLFTFFDTVRLFRIFISHCLPEKIDCLQRVPIHFFWYFAYQIVFSKIPKPPRFHNFRYCEIFPVSVLKFFQVFSARYNRICFFFKTGILSCDFPIRFYWNPFSIFTKNEMFCEHRGLLRVFDTMRLSGDFFSKKQFGNIFSSTFSFSRCFVVSSWGKMVFGSYRCVSLEVKGTVKLMKFQQKCTFAYVKNYFLEL